MSIKVKQALTSCLIKISNSEFDEDTIRTLLITSREYINKDGLIKELAHFIAHPTRDKGIFHKKVNNRYAKLKLIEEQVLKFQSPEFQSKIKTEEELSDFMLNAINSDKIESKLFNILYSDGLDDLSEEYLIKYTGFNKSEIKKLLQENYTKKENYYYLNVLKTEKMITLLQSLPKDENHSDEELNKSINQGSELIQKVRNTIDRIQKVVRGAIHFNSVFEQESLSLEFETVFADVLNYYNIDNSFLESIKQNIDGILLCLLTLLHDSKFTFYDKNIARTFLCCYHSLDNKLSESSQQLAYENGVIALYINYKIGTKSNTYPLYVSKLKIRDYLTLEEYLKHPSDNYIAEIPWITAKRLNQKLSLATE